MPELQPDDVSIMDNLPSYKQRAVSEMFEAAGATLRFPRPYPRFHTDRESHLSFQGHALKSGRARGELSIVKNKKNRPCPPLQRVPILR